MELKKNTIEFKSMLTACEGDVSKLSRLLRNKYRLNQAVLGTLTGVHRNAVIRLESGKCANPARWLRELFLVQLICNDNVLYNDVISLRKFTKTSPLEVADEETGGLFKEFVTQFSECEGDVAKLSKALRNRYNLTQKDLAELLGADRTTVTQLEGYKHKYPERLLVELYFSLILLKEPESKDYVLSLKQKKVKRPQEAGERPEVPEAAAPETGEEITAGKLFISGTREEVTAVRAGDTGSSDQAEIERQPDSAASRADNPEEQENLRKYGFRTRQEFYNTMRSGELALEQKRRLALIDTQWTHDLKMKESLNAIRIQMKTVKDKINREIYDRTSNNQTAFLRASNSYKKGMSIAEIAQENNGYFSLPFCNLWEKHGFSLVKFLAWRPSPEDVYEIYKDFEPEFKMNTLEYKFRPRKNPPAPAAEKVKGLNTLLKEWFHQLAEEINAE